MTQNYAGLINKSAFLGKVGDSLCCRQAMLLARSYGDLLSPEGDATFAIGYDTRDSSPSLAEAVSLGLRSGGHHVIHIGMCTSPQLEWYVTHLSLRGGIMITGASAPMAWNGMHLCGADAKPISAISILEALKIDDLELMFSRPCNPILEHERPLSAYAAWLRQRLRPNQQIKLCLDVCDGKAGDEFEAVIAHYQQLRLWRINIKPDLTTLLTQINDDLYATTQSNDKLANCVLSKGCHLGAALDADGSRLMIIDDNGQPIKPHVLGVMLAQALNKQYSGIRVFHDSYLSVDFQRILQEDGLKTQITDGDISSTWASLHDSGPAFYFDHEGHYAFSYFPGTANALLALIELINHISESNSHLSTLTYNLKKRCKCSDLVESTFLRRQ